MDILQGFSGVKGGVSKPQDEEEVSSKLDWEVRLMAPRGQGAGGKKGYVFRAFSIS
jgi:hypothetical protein